MIKKDCITCKCRNYAQRSYYECKQCNTENNFKNYKPDLCPKCEKQMVNGEFSYDHMSCGCYAETHQKIVALNINQTTNKISVALFTLGFIDILIEHFKKQNHKDIYYALFAYLSTIALESGTPNEDFAEVVRLAIERLPKEKNK